MADWAELDRIRTARGRPYAVELSEGQGGNEPAAVITAYGRGSDPIVLWGSWLGSEVIIGVEPLVARGGLDAADCWGPLKVWPQLPVPVSDAVGGGWFAVLGYDPGTSWLAFCDAVLRRRVDGSWVFESLGLAGREDSMAAALARAQTALSEAAGASGAGRPGAPAIGPLSPAIGPLSPAAGLPAAADDHLAGVERVIGRIRAGEVYQLNLCTRLTGDLMVDPLELFVRTAGATQPAYGAHLPTGTDLLRNRTTLVSLSPERFLTVGDGRVTTSPIKGTTKRSEDPDGSVLRSSTKDAAENIMITDLMRNDLSRVCVPGSVAVTGLLEIQPHPGVWHLVSTVTGALVEGLGPADLLAATFPPGSVTGAPKSSAVRAIALEEPHHRGAYTGAAGLITVDGRAELSVLIRTFEASGGRVELGVGGGITVDSVPVREWQECLHKAEPLARAAGSRLIEGLDDGSPPVPAQWLAQGVFETVLAQHGSPLRLADHLARLARSVRELYGRDLPSDLVNRVMEVAGTTGGDPRSAVRVHVAPSDDELNVTVTSRPLGPRLQTCRLALATRSAVSWRHKWADRTELQAAEALTAPALPYFLDPTSRVAETSRGNLFVQDADGLWRTPPASEHVLPGVTRRALLDVLGDRGIDVEISPSAMADLGAARAIVWTSSLSGVVAVSDLDGRHLAQDGSSETWTSWLDIG